MRRVSPMTAPLISVSDLSVSFYIRNPGAWRWTPPRKLYAVSEVSLDLASGECLGVVGESGSGKSTLARALIGTVPATGGRILFDGQDMMTMEPAARRSHRRNVQMVFQDPLAALNLRMPVGDIIAERLVTHHPEISRATPASRCRP